MSKSFLFFLVVLLTLLGYIFNIDKDISKYYYNFSDSIKQTYQKSYLFIKDGINLYLNQITTIEELRARINENKNYKILYETTNNDFQKLLNDLNATPLEFDTLYTRVVSYTNLNDYSRIILDKPIKKNKIYPILTTDGYAAGIAIHQQNRDIGFLNNNEKCNYAVFIGMQNAPGITSGMDKNGHIIIKHIPIWFKINENDEVITSGMDRTFPTGVKVGEVVGVKTLINTKEAYVKPYVDVLTKRDFFMIEKR